MRVINILAPLGLVSAHKLKSHWISGADDMLRDEENQFTASAHKVEK